MERDIRRSPGQWRGCYAFDHIICDGDDSTAPRKGGLKMGSTYYYYYELDGGVEVHDSRLPHTSSCPYLPGQPVNLLSVPVEVRRLRRRSVSMSAMSNGDIMTMNPADKFVTPRPPPRPPVIVRLSTSPSEPTPKPSSCPQSPKSEKSPWSPRMFFGIRSPESKKSRRSTSVTKKTKSKSPRESRSESAMSSESAPPTRTSSLQSSRSHSPELSPLSRSINLELSKKTHIASLMIPDGITEDLEDDANFASPVNNRISLSDRYVFTPLSPPPSYHVRPLTARHVSTLSSSSSSTSSTDTSKPLPQVPTESVEEQIPLPLRFRQSEEELPSSRFSISTISTSMSSRDSYLGLVSDDEELAVDLDTATDDDDDDEFVFRPLSKDASGRLFTGYSLPEVDHSSEQTLCKEPLVQKSRATFGGVIDHPTEEDGQGSSSPLHDLLNEMGYLGEMIAGK
ncbi:hypothetical protein B7463_g5320, partial [Scytalidium lignicola]